MTTLDEVAAESVRDAGDVHERWEAGELTDDQFVALAAAAVLRANTRATVLADVLLARELSGMVGSRVSPLGLTLPRTEVLRLRVAFGTLAAADQPAGARVARLADNEPKAAAAKARGEGIQRSPRTTGWTRTASSIACKACQRLTGTVLSTNTAMWRHTGCSCTQTPVTK